MRVERMMEQLLFSTVRIECETPTGVGTGTAFIVDRSATGSPAGAASGSMPILVTNKHVVEGASKGRFFFTKSIDNKPQIGHRLDVEFDNFEGRWYGHPDPNIDVAILPLASVIRAIQQQGETVFYISIPVSCFPSSETVQDLDALEEVTFIGYPNGVYDSKNLLPIVRRGTAATPIQLDYEGRPVFLIDASVFPGSSGSPVLICNDGMYMNRGNAVVGTRVVFLGIIAEVLIRRDQGELDFVSIPTSIVPLVRTVQMIDLGVVFKHTAVLETIDLYLRSKGTRFDTQNNPL